MSKKMSGVLRSPAFKHLPKFVHLPSPPVQDAGMHDGQGLEGRSVPASLRYFSPSRAEKRRVDMHRNGDFLEGWPTETCSPDLFPNRVLKRSGAHACG